MKVAITSSFVVSLAVGGVLALSGVAQAHPWTDLYDNVDGSGNVVNNDMRWLPQDHRPVFWAFTQSMMNAESNYRLGVLLASDTWTRQDSSFSYQLVSAVADFEPNHCSKVPEGPRGPRTLSTIHRIAGSGNFVLKCFQPNSTRFLRSFQMVLEPDLWADPNLPPPPDKWDLRWAATHEFAHGTGWGNVHYRYHNKSSAICGLDPGYHTMCEEFYNGRDWGRSLEPHDVGTFRNAYPPDPPPDPPDPGGGETCVRDTCINVGDFATVELPDVSDTLDTTLPGEDEPVSGPRDSPPLESPIDFLPPGALPEEQKIDLDPG